MFRRALASLTVSVVAAVLLTLPSTPAHAYTPTAGPVFSSPGGNQIAALIKRNIANAPSRSVIRAAVAITDMSIARALAAAHARGVDVRMVLPGNTSRGCSSSASKYLIGKLGTNLSRRSWVKCIQGSARNEPGRSGHMHMKVWAFSKVGTAREVMVVTSSNATDNGNARQYNDAYQSVGWSNLYGGWSVTVFPQLRDDAGGGFWRRTWDASEAYATPVSLRSDPIRRRVAALPAASTTQVRVAVSTIEYDDKALRAVQIAQHLIAKRKAGASVQVLHTRTLSRYPRAVRMMCANGIPVREFTNVGDTSPAYLHSKYMTASYVSSGRRVHRVWTGSEEWKTLSLGQDEFVVGLGSKSTHDKYAANFGTLWSRAKRGCP